jgi:hypothetical protein
MYFMEAPGGETITGRRRTADITPEHRTPARRPAQGNKPRRTPSAPPTPPTPRPTVFHPGVNHDHRPTGKWADVQSDASRRCSRLRDEALRNPRRALSIAEQIGTECACSSLPPSAVAATVRNTIMQVLPLAQRHLDHYLRGGGADLRVDIADVLRSDSGVRGKLLRNIRASARGHFKVNQSDYAVKDFQFAFGAIDRLDYEVNRSAGAVHVWFKDRYEWHPVGFGYKKFRDDSRRVSNCVHAAMVELKSSGASDYWMVGEATIPLTDLTSPAPTSRGPSGSSTADL